MNDAPIKSVEDGKRLIDEYEGPPESFKLLVPDSLNDPVGWNMAFLTDRILAKGWEPRGFEQKSGYRVYLYRLMD